MIENIGIELGSLVILVIVLIHVRMNKHIKTFSNKMFLAFVVCGVIDICLDIFTTVMVNHPDVFNASIQNIALEVFYLFQAIMPYLLFMYVLTLRDFLKKEHLPMILIYSSVFIFMVIIVASNTWSGLLFKFEGNINVGGPLYYSMYTYALIYLVASLIDTIVHFKILKKENVFVIWEFVIICSIAVVIQMMYTEILLTGVGIAFSLIVLMLTINNPIQKIDDLTNLFELSGFFETLIATENKRHNYKFVIVAIDNLKRINMVYGMNEGNKVLKDFTTYLLSFSNKTQLFRFIGTRFVIMCDTEQQYKKTLSNVEKYFNKNILINEAEVKMSACICGITNTKHCETPNELIEFIDYMITDIKKIGAGTYKETNDIDVKKYLKNKEIESYICEAIEKNLFHVNYQPVYSEYTNSTKSIEALARLEHPKFGTISPDEFIPIAERNGEIELVDNCILTKVCKFVSENEEILEGIENIKINVSPYSLLNIGLSNRMLSTMQDYNVPPSKFMMEITETAATVYEKEAKAWSEQMKSRGVKLALDDFGSGYANLDSVMKLPFDLIKMDRSMLLDAMEMEKAKTLYIGITSTLKTMGFEIVAEGAETMEHIEFLVSLGVRYVQGYYYAKPMTDADLIYYLSNENTGLH